MLFVGGLSNVSGSIVAVHIGVIVGVVVAVVVVFVIFVVVIVVLVMRRSRHRLATTTDIFCKLQRALGSCYMYLSPIVGPTPDLQDYSKNAVEFLSLLAAYKSNIFSSSFTLCY